MCNESINDSLANISGTPFRLTPCGVSLLIPHHLYALVEFHQQIFELDFMLGIQIINFKDFKD